MIERRAVPLLRGVSAAADGVC